VAIPLWGEYFTGTRDKKSQKDGEKRKWEKVEKNAWPGVQVANNKKRRIGKRTFERQKTGLIFNCRYQEKDSGSCKKSLCSNLPSAHGPTLGTSLGQHMQKHVTKWSMKSMEEKIWESLIDGQLAGVAGGNVEDRGRNTRKSFCIFKKVWGKGVVYKE